MDYTLRLVTATLAMVWLSSASIAATLTLDGAGPVPVTGAKPIAPTDVLLSIDPAASAASQAWRLQCDGRFADAKALARSAGELPAAAASPSAFGRSNGPVGAERPALRLAVRADGAKIGGSPRCEIGFFKREAQALPRGQVFWHAFCVWLEDWSGTRDQMAITQWYHGMPGAQLNPPFVMVASGKRLFATLRYSTEPGPIRQADQKQAELFQIVDGSFYGRWLHVVIQAQLSTDPAGGGFMIVHINGRPVADYRGPIGYASRGAVEQVVHGIYPLVKGRIPFDATLPQRHMYLARSLVVADPTRKYTANDLLKALE